MLDEIFNKYSDSVLRNLDKNNIKQIIKFLEENNCCYVDDLLEDYLDLFTIDYNIFVNRFNKCNEKYNGEYLNLVEEDMNLLEEMFYD